MSKVRISEEKTKTFLSFLEREYLRAKLKGSAKFRFSEKNANLLDHLRIPVLDLTKTLKTYFRSVHFL